jgi:hypothetical protein
VVLCQAQCYWPLYPPLAPIEQRQVEFDFAVLQQLSPDIAHREGTVNALRALEQAAVAFAAARLAQVLGKPAGNMQALANVERHRAVTIETINTDCGGQGCDRFAINGIGDYHCSPCV